MTYLPMPEIYYIRMMEWIRKHRIPSIGPLDVEAMGELIEVPIETRSLQTGYGRFVEPGTEYPNGLIILAGSLSSSEHSLTFGHEVGHWVLFRLKDSHWLTRWSQDSESFCEWLGREMVLPSWWLKENSGNKATLKQATESWDVSERTLVLQLQAVGLVEWPKVFGGELLCPICTLANGNVSDQPFLGTTHEVMSKEFCRHYQPPPSDPYPL